MANWLISLEKRIQGGDFRVLHEVRSPPGVDRGGDGEKGKWYCELPPKDLAWLVAPFAAQGGNDANNRGDAGQVEEILEQSPPERKWRRAPGIVDAVHAHADNLQFVGEILYRALFTDEKALPPKDTTPAFSMLVSMLKGQERYTNIIIELTDAPELVPVPWEALFQKDRNTGLGRFLATDIHTNVVRTLRLKDGTPGCRPVRGAIKVLLIAANPEGDLDVDQEIATIEEIVRKLARATRGFFKRAPFVIVDIIRAASQPAVYDAILKHKPHILHYIGHGGFSDGTGHIRLHDPRDPSKGIGVDTTNLRQLVQNYPPWLIVLNSCQGAQTGKINPFGGAAQGLLDNGVPFVVAMQYPISDGAAKAFSEGLYTKLAEGAPVVQAVSEGRNAIANKGFRDELATPVLYTTGQTDVIGREPAKVHGGWMSSRWTVAAAAAFAGVVGAALVAVFLESDADKILRDELGPGFIRNDGSPPSALPPVPTAGVPEPTTPDASDFRDAVTEGVESIASGGGSSGLEGESPSPGSSAGSPVTGNPGPDPGPAGVSSGVACEGEEIEGQDCPEPPAAIAPPPPSPPPAGQECWDGSTPPITQPCPPRPAPPPPVITPPPSPEPYCSPWPVCQALSGVIRPPPTPSQPPPPPPPPAQCEIGPYIVFFDWDADSLQPDVEVILDNAVEAYTNCAGRAVMLAGHTDSSGPLRYNAGLAERRNMAVRDYLTDQGVPGIAISSQAFGESQLRVPTADGVRELQNRRVEITFGPDWPSAPPTGEVLDEATGAAADEPGAEGVTPPPPTSEETGTQPDRNMGASTQPGS